MLICDSNSHVNMLDDNNGQYLICQDSGDSRHTHVYSGGECVACPEGSFGRGRDERCKECATCGHLGAMAECSAGADSQCILPIGPFITADGPNPAPTVIDAATFTSRRGEMWMFGGQGPPAHQNPGAMAGPRQSSMDTMDSTYSSEYGCKIIKMTRISGSAQVS